MCQIGKANSFCGKMGIHRKKSKPSPRSGSVHADIVFKIGTTSRAFWTLAGSPDTQSRFNRAGFFYSLYSYCSKSQKWKSTYIWFGVSACFYWCRGTESHWRHGDFQLCSPEIKNIARISKDKMISTVYCKFTPFGIYRKACGKKGIYFRGSWLSLDRKSLIWWPLLCAALTISF
jgi:hypothetical protein